MNDKYLKFVVPIILMLPVALFIGISIKSSGSSPATTIHYKKITGFKPATGPSSQISKNFIINNLLNNPVEYSSFPLIQKATLWLKETGGIPKKPGGSYLGNVPESVDEVVGQADFTIGNTAYKAYNDPKTGTKATLVAIPEYLYVSRENPIDPGLWKKPKDFGYKENFPYVFPFVLRGTPLGTIRYQVYVSDESPTVNEIMELRQKKIEEQRRAVGK